MITTLQQLIALSPLLFVGLTVIALMLSVSYRRNHLSTIFISIFGLSVALIFLLFTKREYRDTLLLLCNDNYARFYGTLVLLSTLAVCLLSYPWLENLSENKEEFYLLVLTSTVGAIVLTSASHFLTLFLGIELISLPLFGLVGYNSHNRFSTEVSIKYTILSITASSFFLFGIAILYTKSKNLSFLAFGKILNNEMTNNPILLLGFGLIMIGFFLKLSLAPFHLWIPEVYQGAPTSVSVFLSTVSKIAIFSALVRLFLCVSWCNNKAVYVLLNSIAFITILLGNLMALSQTNIKRLLGCSSISHTGYLLIILITLQDKMLISMEAIAIYLVGYSLSNLGIFSIIYLISSSHSQKNAAVDSLSSYRGLFRYHPVLSVVMTIILLSLAGIPITLGFFGKFYVLFLTIQENMWWLSIAIVVSSAIGFYYYLRLAASLYVLKNSEHTISHFFNSIATFNVPCNWFRYISEVIVLISAISLVVLGIYPQPLINIAQYMIPTIT